MQAVVNEFGEDRRTAILSDENASAPVAEVRAAIESKPVLVALANDGGLKTMPVNTFAGKSNAGTVRGDERLLSVTRALTTDYLLCQLSTGRVASVRVARLPEMTRAARAELARAFISLDPGERVVDVAAVSAFSEEVYLVVFTREGRVKKTPLSEYIRVDEKPTPDLRLLGKDAIVAAVVSPGGGDYVVTTSDGKTLRFADADLRGAGRVGQGVQAIGVGASASVVAAEWVAPEDDRTLFVAASNGLVKRSLLADYPRKGRATGGVATMQLAPRTVVVAAAVLGPVDDALLIAQSGRTARVNSASLPLVARDRKGSVALKLEGADLLSRVVALPGT
jgi:DNA gyrase subunit A